MPPDIASNDIAMDEVPQDATAIKSCCALIYEHDAVRALVGETLHPGGLKLTGRLGVALQLGPQHHLLDLASARGNSALHLAETTGCRVTGIDYSEAMVAEARDAAATRGLADRVRFDRADAERLPYGDGSFDAVLCECAFCLFPDKRSAATEIARVLKPGGRLALSDITLNGELPDTLKNLAGWVACIADARPLADYVGHLEWAGLQVEASEAHDTALLELINTIRFRVMGADILRGLGKLDIPRNWLPPAKEMTADALAAVKGGALGYASVVASKPPGDA